uniref:Uncharacterized protein n=1 Tax=Plectus sambesii TaxID=2011161 RepID=A0A914WEL5_9BILA
MTADHRPARRPRASTRDGLGDGKRAASGSVADPFVRRIDLSEIAVGMADADFVDHQSCSTSLDPSDELSAPINRSSFSSSSSASSTSFSQTSSSCSRRFRFRPMAICLLVVVCIIGRQADGPPDGRRPNGRRLCTAADRTLRNVCVMSVHRLLDPFPRDPTETGRKLSCLIESARAVLDGNGSRRRHRGGVLLLLGRRWHPNGSTLISD